MERNFDITESFSSIADYSDKIPNSIMAQYADGQTSISFHSGAERKIGNYKWFVFKWDKCGKSGMENCKELYAVSS